MIGDGATDMEAKPPADLFIGFVSEACGLGDSLPDTLLPLHLCDSAHPHFAFEGVARQLPSLPPSLSTCVSC